MFDQQNCGQAQDLEHQVPQKAELSHGTKKENLVKGFSTLTFDILNWVILFQGSVLCFVGCLASSLASSCQQHPPIVTTKMSPGTAKCPGGDGCNPPLLRTTSLDDPALKTCAYGESSSLNPEGYVLEKLKRLVQLDHKIKNKIIPRIVHNQYCVRAIQEKFTKHRSLKTFALQHQVHIRAGRGQILGLKTQIAQGSKE